MRPEICRKGSISKRSDGYWLGTIYYLNEYGQRKRKAFGGKLKKIVMRKMTDFISEFNRKAAEYEYGNKLLKDALLEYMKEIKYCPFCKNKDVDLLTLDKDNDDAAAMNFIHCTKCGASTMFIVAGFLSTQTLPLNARCVAVVSCASFSKIFSEAIVTMFIPILSPVEKTKRG